MSVLSNMRIGKRLIIGISLLLLLVCGAMGVLAYITASNSLSASVEEALVSLAGDAARYLDGETAALGDRDYVIAAFEGCSIYKLKQLQLLQIMCIV